MKNIFKCESGNFKGIEKNGVIYVKGIRYAKSKRYDVPTPYKYDNNISEQITDSPFCVQLASPIENYLAGVDYEKYPQEESCQYLSISLPSNIENHKIPVMVFFHGGAYRNGGCDSPIYNSEAIVKEGNVIVVKVNYRLNIFGFVKDISGNYSNNGLLDAIEALKWIKSNIKYFGGDINNITLFGQSAGADCIRCIMLSQDTDNLYNRVILQSDPLGAMENRNKMDYEILKKLNSIPINASLDELKKINISIEKNINEKGNAKHMKYAPHYGIYPLPNEEEICKRLSEVARKHDMLIGYNTREASAYVGPNKRLKKLYDFKFTKNIIEKVIIKKSNQIFINPIKQFAYQYSKFGGKVYLYDFHWNEKNSPIGACHGMELIMLFSANGFKDREIMCSLSEKEIYELGKGFRKIWYTFAKTGEICNYSIENMLNIHNLS